MNWTTDQVAKRRTRSWTYRNTVHDTAPTRGRDGKGLVCAYSAPYAENEQSIKVFPRHLTLHQELAPMLQGITLGRITGRDDRGQVGKKVLARHRALRQRLSMGNRTLRFFVEAHPTNPGLEK